MRTFSCSTPTHHPPDKKWINLDTVVENKKKTITSVDFIEEEGAFMAGVVAGLVTTDTSIPGVNRDKVVGAVCGDDDPVIRGFCTVTSKAQSISTRILK